MTEAPPFKSLSGLNPLGNVAVYCLLRAKLLFQVAPEFHVAGAGMVNAQVGSPPAGAFLPVLRVRQCREPSKVIVTVRHPPMMHSMVVAEYFAFPWAATIGNDVAWVSRSRNLEKKEIRAVLAVGRRFAQRPGRRFLCPGWMLWLLCIIHWGVRGRGFSFGWLAGDTSRVRVLIYVQAGHRSLARAAQSVALFGQAGVRLHEHRVTVPQVALPMYSFVVVDAPGYAVRGNRLA
jgi:hypothetical protein